MIVNPCIYSGKKAKKIYNSFLFCHHLKGTCTYATMVISSTVPSSSNGGFCYFVTRELQAEMIRKKLADLLSGAFGSGILVVNRDGYKSRHPCD